MKRTAPALVLALALVLTACGDDGGEDTAAAPEATASAEPRGEPTGDAAQDPASAPECPLQAEEVAAPEGVGDDLGSKPEVPAQSAPPPTAITYADVVEGDGEVAQAGDQVQAKYVGAFYESGEEFDSSWSRGQDETLPFGLCTQGVIPGFAVGPIGMKVGGRRVITIPSEFGYGAEGSPPTIPGNATLVFVVDLVSVD